MDFVVVKDPVTQVIEVATKGPKGDTGAPGEVTESELIARTRSAVLASDAAVGADHITINGAAPVPGGYVVIDPWSINAEVRLITSASGSQVNFGTKTLSRAHSAITTPVYFFTGSEVPIVWWNAPTDGTTSASTQIQAAIQSLQDAGLLNFNGLWLTGGSNTFAVDRPIMLSNLLHLRYLTILVLATYSPADANGAVLMSFRGNVRTFTAAASGDLFTTSGVHGLVVGDQVVHKGSSLPGGLTDGQVYWVKTVPTTSTYTLATDSTLATTLDLTSDGSGSEYPTPQALCRVYLDHVYVFGPTTGSLLTASLNGIRCNLQQPSIWHTVRVDRFNQYGIWISGQQCIFHNIELIQNRVGLAIDNGKFFYFYGFDPEQNVEAGCRILGSTSVFGGSMSNCLFNGVHFENSGGEWCFDLVGTTRALSIDNIYGFTKLLWCHTGAVTTSGYTIRYIRLNGTSGATYLQDDDRGVTKTIPSVDGNLFLEEIEAAYRPTGGATNDEARHELILPDGGYIRHGSAQDFVPKWAMRPGASQTGHSAVYRDKAGVDALAVDKDAYLRIIKHAAPTLSDLAAGQLVPWWDQDPANPRAMLTAKDSGGTAKTVEVADFARLRRTRRKSGAYYPAAGAQAISAVQTLDLLLFFPIFLDTPWAVDRVGGYTAGTPRIRHGIYAPDADGLPGALVNDWGTIGAGVAGFFENAIAYTIPAGLMWGASVMQVNAGSVARISLADPYLPAPIITPTVDVAISGSLLQRASVSGALPDPAGVLGVTLVNAASSVAPQMVFRTA